MISPRDTVKVCLPWRVEGRRLTGLFPLLHGAKLAMSIQFSAKSGRINVLLSNFDQAVAVVAAKTFVVGVGSLDGEFWVQRTDGGEWYLSDGMSLECGAKEWSVATVDSGRKFLAQFPQLFSEETCDIPEAMWAYAVRKEDVTLVGEIRCGGKCAYNVENLVPRKAIEETIRDMVNSQYVEEVEPGRQLYLHPLIFLPKGDGRTRLVIDLRRMNGHTKNVEGGLPAVHTVLRQIPTQWRFFCKLDLRNGYHRVPLDKDMRNFFAFGIGRRWYRYRVLPQGWNASPLLFHEIVMRICRGIEVLHYIDDLLLGAATLGELGERVTILLERLHEHGLQVQKKKFEFGVQKLEFLGFTVQSGGRVSAERYLTTRRAAVQADIRTRRDLQSLLGTFNVARHFVPDMAGKVRGLQQILKTLGGSQIPAETRERVRMEVEGAWEAVLKAAVTLQMGDGAAITGYELFTDWSAVSVGYVLFALTERGPGIIDVNSATSTVGPKTSSFLGELRGIQWALQKVRHIIWTGPVKICCDNAGTVQRLQRMGIMGDDVRCSRLMAWIMENFPQARFEYVPGVRNVMADYLSRSQVGRVPGKPLSEVAVLDVRPSDEEVEQRLEAAHRGHWHAERTWQHLKRDGDVWPGAREEVYAYVRRCRSCQYFRGLEHREPWGGLTTNRPNEVVYSDFLGPIRLSRGRGKRVLLVLVDGFSRYTHIHLAKGPTERTVVRALRRWLLATSWRHGAVKMLVTDRGAAFTGKAVGEFCARHRIDLRWTASHAPWSNGAAERQVGNVKARLARLLWGTADDVTIPELEDILNQGICRGTGFTPNEICWGRRRNGTVMTESEWASAIQRARKRRIADQQRERRRYQQKYASRPPILAGQWVLAYEPHKKQHALHSPWTGPHLTSSPRGTKLWMLWQNGGSRLMGPFHIEQLRHYQT